MESSVSVNPDFVREQIEAAGDPVFNAQLVEIAQQFASQKKRVIFISRAWPLPLNEDKFGEQWSGEFPIILAKHLRLLGFEVKIDVDDAGVGRHLNPTMEEFVEVADHVLLVITKTYLHKIADCFDRGVAIELSFIIKKIERMGGAKVAGERRFLLPLALTNDLTGFGLVEGHSGFAAIFVGNVGYRRALIDLATKVYNVEPRLLREVVPSHANVLIQAVKKCYQEKKYIPRPFHDEPLPIEKGFVRLAIVKEEEQNKKMSDQFSGDPSFPDSEPSGDKPKLFQDRRLTCFEQIHGAKEPVDITDIFEPDKEGKDKEKIPKRLLVLGRAGIGKSILCQKMAHQWANLDIEEKLWEEHGQEKFKLVVWVPLRNLLDYSESEVLSDVILKECISKDHTGVKSISKEVVLRGLKELKPDDILYVCDGYDEVAGRTTPLIDEILGKENVFVTTRPHGINHYLTSDNARPFDRKFENIGFLDEDIENYIRVFFGSEEESQTHTESLLGFLKAHPNIWGIAHIPINLMLICVAWKDNYNRIDLSQIKNLTITDLYYALLVNLGRRFLDKNKVKGLHDFTAEDVLEHDKCKPVLAVLSELAFQQMEHESLLIPGQSLSKGKLRKQYPELFSLRDDVIHFGLLSPTRPETNNEKTEFYFVHLTFQEFLTAFYIAEKLKTSDENIKQYILRNKYSPRHELVWWFVAGLLKDETKVLEMFFDILESKPQDLAQVYHHMLLMRCMDECQLKISAMRKNRYISKLGHLLSTNNNWCVSLCYKVFLAYASLSSNVFSDPHMIALLEDRLGEKDQFKTRRIMGLLKNHQQLPEHMLMRIARLFNQPDSITVERAIKFFSYQVRVSDDVEKDIGGMLDDANEMVREAACGFFSTRKIVLREIENCIAARLKDPSERVVRSAIEFFGTRKEVSDEIQDQIASCATASGYVTADAAVKFFESSKNISEKIANRVTAMLKSSDKSTRETAFKLCSKVEGIFTRVEECLTAMLFGVDVELKKEAIIFFTSYKNVPRVVEDYLEKLLTAEEWQVRYCAVGFFTERKRLSEEVENHIAAMLLDPSNRLKVQAVRFFRYRPKVSVNVQESITLWLTHSEEELKIAAIYFFASQEDILPVVEGKIVALLDDPSEEVRESVIKFFSERTSVPEEVEKKMEAYLVEPDYCDFRTDVIDFFCARKTVSKKVENFIADLLSDPDESLTQAAIEFFSTRDEVLEEVQQRISDLVAPSEPFFSLEGWVSREKAVEFFLTRKKVPETIMVAIAGLFLDPDSIGLLAATTFFGSRESVPQHVFEMIGSALPTGETVDFLRAIPISRILKCINHINKESILEDFIKVLVGKLLTTNMPFYQVNDVCLQVDESCQVVFNSQDERINFCENFREVLQTYTSYIFEGFSSADTLASVGLLPSPRQNSNNEVLPAKTENTKSCVIC